MGKSPHTRSVLLHKEVRSILLSMVPSMTSGKSLSLCLAALSTVRAQPTNDGLLEAIERRVGQLTATSKAVLSEQDYALLLNALARMDRDSDIIFSAAFDALSRGNVSFTVRGLSALLNAVAKLQREVPGCAIPELLHQVRDRTKDLSGWQLACVVHGLGRSVPNASKDGEMITGLSNRADEVVREGDVSHQGYVMLLDGFSRLDCLQMSIIKTYSMKAPEWGLSEQAIVIGIASMARVNYYDQTFLHWSVDRLTTIRRIPAIGLVTALVGYAKLAYQPGISYMYKRIIIDEDILSSINCLSQYSIVAYALLLSGRHYAQVAAYNVLLRIIHKLLPKPSLSNATRLQLIATMRMLLMPMKDEEEESISRALSIEHIRSILALELFDTVVKVGSSSMAEPEDSRTSTFQEEVGHTLRRLGDHHDQRRRRWAEECELTPYLVDIVEVKLLPRRRDQGLNSGLS